MERYNLRPTSAETIEGRHRPFNPANYDHYKKKSFITLQDILTGRGLRRRRSCEAAISALMINDQGHADLPFRFMELPVEIRLIILRFITTEENDISDRWFKFPSVTIVKNKEFHKLCLDTFFGDNEFFLTRQHTFQLNDRPITDSVISRLARIELKYPRIFELWCEYGHLLRSLTIDVTFAVLFRRNGQVDLFPLYINIDHKPLAVKKYIVKVKSQQISRFRPFQPKQVRPDHVHEEVRKFVQEYLDKTKTFKFSEVDLKALFSNGIPEEMTIKDFGNHP